MRFFCEVAYETMKKVCLPLQTLEFSDISRGGQGQNSSNFQRIYLDAIFGNHKAQKTSSFNKKDTFVCIKPNVIMTTPKKNVSKVP